jgi:hypothetical protein
VAYQEHDWLLVGLKTDFSLDPIRSDPRRKRRGLCTDPSRLCTFCALNVSPTDGTNRAKMLC